MKHALWGALTLVLGANLLSAQDKRTVAEYFVECPALTYQAGSESDDLSWIQATLENPLPPSAQQRRAKQLLLAGVPVDYDHPVSNLVVDAKNGYLHLTVADDDLTLVYFEKTDKTRIVAFRLENISYQFPTTTWAFFEVMGTQWTRIADKDILPPSGTLSFFPKGLTSTDKDALLLTEWDIFLPQFGTTARLTPIPYSTDLESPDQFIGLPGTNRKMRYGSYVDWFHQTFENPSRAPKSLDLKWNKAAGRFDAGKIAVAPSVATKPKVVRGSQDMLTQPQNIWEDFLSDPELVYDGDGGLYWDPNRKDHEGWAQKQELLTDDGLGLMLLEPADSLVLDLPAGYLSFALSRQGPDPESHGAGEAVVQATLQFTMASYTGADQSRLVGYRFWGHQRPGDLDAPRTEYNQIASTFRRVTKSSSVALNDNDVFPMDQINRFVLKDATAPEQALQGAAVWDVVFLRSSTSVQLVPWRLKPLAPAERKKLVALFGSDQALTEGFASFVRRFYQTRALSLTWNKSIGKFVNPVEVSR